MNCPGTIVTRGIRVARRPCPAPKRCSFRVFLSQPGILQPIYTRAGTGSRGRWRRRMQRRQAPAGLAQIPQQGEEDQDGRRGVSLLTGRFGDGQVFD